MIDRYCERERQRQRQTDRHREQVLSVWYGYCPKLIHRHYARHRRMIDPYCERDKKRERMRDKQTDTKNKCCPCGMAIVLSC